MSFHHTPVLLAETLDMLRPQPGGVFADGTLGGGGHSEAVLERIGNTGRLYGIDRDQDALAAATARLESYPGFHAIHGNFHDAIALLEGVPPLDGALLDLGVSSYQLDTPERGFSYHEDAPLDMRMDQSTGLTAADWLNTMPQQDIRQALYDYADERWGARIAQIIVEMRAQQPFQVTGDLVRAVDKAIPRAVRSKDTGHPARRTFQAVRIAVNDEIAPLRQALYDWLTLLKPGGRLCVITFHSIEDRVVKQAFRAMQHPCTCPPKAPICTCGKTQLAKVLAGGAVKPSQSETDQNPRARSAVLRGVEKVG